MVTDHLVDRIAVQPILPIKRSVTIGTIISFDGLIMLPYKDSDPIPAVGN